MLMSPMEKNKAGIGIEEVGMGLQFSTKEGFYEMVTFERSLKRSEGASQADVQSTAPKRE